MKTYDGKTISKKHIVEVLRTMDLTAICRLYKQVNGSVPTSTKEVDGADKIRKHLNTFAVLDWTYQFATSRWMRTDLRELFYSPKAGLKTYYDQVYSLTSHGHYEPLQKAAIVEHLKRECQDVNSPYAKRPMMGYTHLYFCSPVYGHSDYNKWCALPIKGNERFCELVVRYADKFFGPVYDSNNRYYITMNSKYVATESDIDMGGFVDADPENFGFQTREEAEQVKDELVDYAYNKACQEDEDYERDHTREDIAATFGIEEIDTDEE